MGTQTHASVKSRKWSGWYGTRSHWLVELSLWIGFAAPVNAQIVAYEATSVFPESDPDAPWTRVGSMDAQRWLDDGLFCQFLVLGAGNPGPFGQFDGYKRTIGEFTASQSFFITWREVTNVPRSDIGGSPGGLVATSSTGHDDFHFTVTRDQVRFLRDNPIGLVLYVDIAPGVMHTYYLALQGDLSYVWYIDGIAVNSGQYPSPFPISSSLVEWVARYYNDDQAVKWDYVRYGVIPADHSGDFDGNGVVDANDLYFFIDCLLGPDYDAAGPGCKWADMNGDGKADGADIQLFCRSMLPA